MRNPIKATIAILRQNVTLFVIALGIAGFGLMAIRAAAQETQLPHSAREYALAQRQGAIDLPSVPSAALPGSLWYNGDFDGVNALSNEVNTLVTNAHVFVDFTVPAGPGWNVTGLYSRNLILAGFTATQANYEIRSGVSTGNGGTLLFSGTAVPATQTATGAAAFGLNEFTILVSGLNIYLPAGNYHLNVVPLGSGAGRSFMTTTSGANAVGTPPGNNGNEFFRSTFFSFNYALTTAPGISNGSDFSSGIVGTVAVPVCTDSTVTGSNTTPQAINDLATTTSTINISGAGTYLTDLDLRTFITHTFNADLDMTLTSPAGTIVTISSDNAGGNDNVFNGTVWNDSADPDGLPPFASIAGNNGSVTDQLYSDGVLASPLGTEEPLDAFRGENPNGTWTLRIFDDANGDTGQIASWDMTVKTTPTSPGSVGPTSFNNVTSQPIPDGTGAVTSTINVSGLTGRLEDVRALLNIAHTFSSDLQVAITAPNGVTVTLTSNNGGGNDNVFAGTTFNTKADPANQVPFPANSFAASNLATDTVYTNLVAKTTLTPEESLGAFRGINPNGTWTLTVADIAPVDLGTLNSWGLQITTNLCPPPPLTQTGVQTAMNAPNYGSTLTATATVVAVAPGGGVPQGFVNFNDGGNAINGCQNVALSALGAAVCTTTQLPAGTNKVIQAVYLGSANYNGSTGSALQTIGKAPLNVIASSHTVTYGDAAPTVTSSITGFVLGQNSSALTTQPACSTTYAQGSPVSGSQYPTSCSGGVANNYSFNYINGTVTVNKKALTVTADNKSRGYGAANPALTATLSGFIGSDNAGNSTTGTALLTTTATAASPAGSYPITATVGTLQSGNYSFTAFNPGTLTVNAVQLTVTANDQTRVYGAANPPLTFSITGFVNGEGVGALTGTPSITTTANATSAPGSYPITAAQGTLASPNYTFATANGSLTVTQASTTTTITNIAALGTPTQAGQSYAVNWTVAPVAPGAGTPLGQVVVNDGVGAGSAFCTALVSAGTCNLVSTTSGAKTITVTYGGDTNFTGSTAATTHTVINGLTGNVKQFIAFGTNTNLAGVTMTLLNTATQQATTTTTDAGGNYLFSTALGQSYTITPSGLGKAYEAINRTYTNVSGNITGADFIAYDVPGPNAIPRSARVSNQVATQGQAVTVPVLMTTTGVETRVAFSVEYPAGPLGVPTVTCGTGAVNCTLAVNNSLSGKVGITVTPAAALAAGTRELVRVTFPTFASPATSAAIRFGDFPAARDVRNAENNPLPMLYWTDGLISFTGGTLLDGATISGRVTTAAGLGLRNATVTLIDTAGGRRTTITSSFGAYQFEGLETGRDYMLTVASKRYRFATRTVNLTGNLGDVNLVGLE